MPFFAMQYCLNVGRRNKLFHLPVDHVIVKLERLDFLYFFDPLFMPCYSSSTKSGYSFNSYYLYVKCLLWADVDRVYVTVAIGKWTGASAHSVDVVHCSRAGERATSENY